MIVYRFVVMNESDVWTNIVMLGAHHNNDTLRQAIKTFIVENNLCVSTFLITGIRHVSSTNEINTLVKKLSKEYLELFADSDDDELISKWFMSNLEDITNICFDFATNDNERFFSYKYREF